MKLFLFAALALAPLTLHAQTDAMPPDHNTAAPMHHDKPPAPPSTTLAVTFNGATVTLTLADLRALPQVTLTAHNAHSKQDETYTGPLVSDVLAKAGLLATPATEPLILHSYILASATDHYAVIYSAAEMQGSFSTGKVIVALSRAGAPNTGGGNIQLINDTGAKPARWVHALNALTVVTPPR